MISSYDANLLAEHGGPIDITKDWAKRLLRRMGLVKRHGTTKAKINPLDFDALKKQYLADIRTKVYMEDIPADIIINWDHTGLKYVPVSNWTMEHKGVKRVEIAGSDDKRQLTALFSCTFSGKFLSPQVIYAGKSPACLPKGNIPSGWNLTFTPNHWSNEQAMMTYLHAILILYVEKTWANLQLSKNHPALVIFDQFKAQTTENFLSALEQHHISFVEVPANCTDRLQPLDLSINKPVKDHLKGSFQDWYAAGVRRKILTGDGDRNVIDLRLSLLKPLGLKWLESACTYIQTTDFVRNGFHAAGITEAISDLV